MPDINPITLSTAEIAKRLAGPGFIPFDIVMSNGRILHVPTRDHCFVTRILRRIEVEQEDGQSWFVNPLHVANIADRQSTLK